MKQKSRFSATNGAGTPKNRVMAMPCILTWKKLDAPAAYSPGTVRTHTTQTRLVVNNCTDPDL
eukprot:6185391-Lingulodinium_polyedra.AAC.1